MQDKLSILDPESTYHIYNRANGSEKLFRSEKHYGYFLKKYQEYILPIAETFCYCLMPNHFHFLVRIKPAADLITYFNNGKPLPESGKTLPGFETLEGFCPKQFSNSGKTLPKSETLAKLCTKQFSNLFNSYTQSFNKEQHRIGSLFIKPYKRKKVTDHAYLIYLVNYIHFNPVLSGLCPEPSSWPHSSYGIILSEQPTFLNRTEIIQWFGDEENFKYFHSTPAGIV